MSLRNTTPTTSCIHSNMWIERDFENVSWLIQDDFYLSQITAPDKADAKNDRARTYSEYNDEDEYLLKESSSPSSSIIDSGKPLREKNTRKCTTKYVHVPHRDKPPQVVAKRNARERKRVQAVNSAFVRLRKVVPIDNTRGKRISKVKTLQYAIEYIHQLEEILREHGSYEQFDLMPVYYYKDYDGSNSMEFGEEEC